MPRVRVSVASACAALHWGLLAAVYGRLALRAFLNFPRDWDFLAYHLPGALSAWGLTSYTPEPRLVAVIEGFPALPRVVAGALVLVTGRFSASGALNLVAFGGLLAGLLWLHGRAFSLRWLLTALLGVPLFVLHLASGYVDLFAACWLVLALAALDGLEPASERPFASGLLFVAALVLAMLSKFQAWPIAGLIGLAGLWRFASLLRDSRLGRTRALVLAAALVLGLGAWPLRNMLVFHNPVYPVQFPLAPGLFPNALVEADSGVQNLPQWLAPRSRPVRFAASALEWNRLRPGERYVWSLDMGARANPADSPHHRLGGWFPWTLAWLVAGAALAARRRLVPVSALASFAGALGLVAVLPQGHELRYWLFVPVALAFWTSRAIADLSPAIRRALEVALVAGAAFVLLATRPFAIDARPPEVFAPREARAFWAEQAARPTAAPVKVCDVNPEGIYWSGPHFREFPVTACFSWQEREAPPESLPAEHRELGVRWPRGFGCLPALRGLELVQERAAVAARDARIDVIRRVLQRVVE